MFNPKTPGEYFIAGFYILAFSIVPLIALYLLFVHVFKMIHKSTYGASTHTGIYDSDSDTWYKSGQPSEERVMEDKRVFKQLQDQVRSQQHPNREAYTSAMKKAVRENMNWVSDADGNKTYPKPSMVQNSGKSVTSLFDVDPNQIHFTR